MEQAQAAAVSKALRANVKNLEDESWSSTDIECVVDKYQELLMDLLKCGCKPTVRLLSAGAKVAFAADDVKGRMFAERIVCAISYCRKKAKSMTSGKKLSHGVKVVIKALRESHGQRSPAPGAPLWKGARKLAKRYSEASEQSAPRVEHCSKKARTVDGEQQGIKHVAQTKDQSSASSSSCYDARLSVLALYGGADKTLPTADDAVSLSSSIQELEEDMIDEGPSLYDEDDMVTEGKAQQTAGLLFSQYTDCRKGVLVRDYGFRKEEAKMVPGSSGFAKAIFENGDEEESEVPNAFLKCVEETADGADELPAQGKTKGKGKAKVQGKGKATAQGKGKAKAQGKAKAKAKGKPEGEAQTGKPKGKAQTGKPKAKAQTGKMGTKVVKAKPNSKKKASPKKDPPHPAQPGAGADDSEEPAGSAVEPGQVKKTYRKMWYKNTSAIGIRRGWGDIKQIGCFKAATKEQGMAVAILVCEALEAGDIEECQMREWALARIASLG